MILHFNSVKGYMVTDCCWLASAIILFSLIGIEAQQHRQVQAQFDHHLIYSESFFACIIAAGLYILISVLLTIYIFFVKILPLSSTDKRFIECTSIVFRTNTFIILLLGGAAVYSHIEGWTLMDALYFTDYTLLTIGIGNFVPRTHLGRSLLFPYATGGIISLGLVITSVTSFASVMRGMKLRHLIKEARQEIYGAGSSEKTGKVPSESGPAKNQFPTGNEVLKLRTVKSDFYRRRKWAELGLFMVAWCLLWFLSAAVFRRSERQQGWTYFVALYFTFTSLTTIGYGDFHPTSNFGKVFFIFWSLLALPILTNLVTVMGDVLHGWLVYVSKHIRGHLFHQRRTRVHHGHQCLSHSSAGPNMIMANSPTSRLGPPHSSPNIENRAQGESMSRHALASAPGNNAQCVLSCTGQEQFKTGNISTQYRLMLAEEIQNLVSMMVDESLGHQEKLCCIWSRIIPLLHAGENDAGCSSELTRPMPGKSELDMTKLVDFQEKSADRNAEILWMLNLLVEKLCLDLRKEVVEII